MPLIYEKKKKICLPTFFPITFLYIYGSSTYMHLIAESSKCLSA